MDTNAAYFSNQTFRIGSKEVAVRIYYAGEPHLKFEPSADCLRNSGRR